MPSSDYRFQGEDVGYADMAEAPRRERESKARSIGIGVVVSLALLGLAGLIILGSQPALTPEEIVGRDDYEGQQPARHIFNLYSLKQEQLERDAARKKEAAVAMTQAESTPLNSESPATNQDSVVESAVVNEDRPSRVAESVYVKSELSRTPVSVIGAVKTQASPTSPAPKVVSDAGAGVTVLPVYTIKGNQTNMRALPTTDAPILQTLNKGQTVTVFDENGDWVQVAANDGSGVSGYIHRSLLEN